MKSTIAIVLLCVVMTIAADPFTPGFKVAKPSSWHKSATSGNSALYYAQLDHQAYNDPVYLLDLRGSHYEMGHDAGVLIGQHAKVMYQNFFQALLGKKWFEPLVLDVLEKAIDSQWDKHLSKALPKEYVSELQGVADGGAKVGVPDLQRYLTRIILLANAPGDLQDFILILLREWNETSIADYLDPLLKKDPIITGAQCSMFGVWGNRTNGELFSGRNLDWEKDTGIAQFKCVTVYHPTDTGYPHATFGFMGMWGALAGMSSQGLSVHEANLEENEITFDGFPWVLRLRYVMENAKNLQEGIKVWKSTKNTVGFNHMITSASDAKTGGPAAVAMETMYDYTAFFNDNDPREANATYKGEQIGFPLSEVVWRTNHGYDPTIRQHYEWSQSPSSWSMQRYMMAHDGFKWYDEAKVNIGFEQAINMTSILGDKGHHQFTCTDNTDGSNVLSVAFQPGAQVAWAAWENGHLDSWRPAACNTYVEIDLKPVFAQTGKSNLENL